MVYIDLEIACYPNSNDDYVSRVTKTGQEMCSCIESGFEYVCDFQNARIFRKRKLKPQRFVLKLHNLGEVFRRYHNA